MTGRRIRMGNGLSPFGLLTNIVGLRELPSATHQCNDDFYTSCFPHLRWHESFAFLITFSITCDSSLDVPLGLVTYTLPMPRELHLYTSDLQLMHFTHQLILSPTTS